MEGWIKIHRKITEWQWYKNIPVRVLFEHLILKANHKDNYVGKILIKKGQLLTSIKNLSEETGLTIKQVRTALDKLIETNEVANKSANKYRVITIVNYALYQGVETYEGKQKDKQDGNQRATNNNDNKYINNNNIYINNKAVEKKEKDSEDDFNADEALEKAKNLFSKYK